MLGPVSATERMAYSPGRLTGGAVGGSTGRYLLSTETVIVPTLSPAFMLSQPLSSRLWRHWRIWEGEQLTKSGSGQRRVWRLIPGCPVKKSWFSFSASVFPVNVLRSVISLTAEPALAALSRSVTKTTAWRPERLREIRGGRKGLVSGRARKICSG